MKESYSELEKKIIEYIVQKDRNNEIISTSKILYENWSVIAVEKLKDNQIAIISNDQDLSAEKFIDSQRSVFEIINILKYLEDHYLITVYSCDKPKERLFNEAIYLNNNPSPSNINPIESARDMIQFFEGYHKKEKNGTITISAQGRIETNVNVYHLLSKYIGGLCYPSTELKIFYDNGYKSPDQVRFEKNYCLTKVAISVSVIISLLSFLCK